VLSFKWIGFHDMVPMHTPTLQWLYIYLIILPRSTWNLFIRHPLLSEQTLSEYELLISRPLQSIVNQLLLLIGVMISNW